MPHKAHEVDIEVLVPDRDRVAELEIVSNATDRPDGLEPYTARLTIDRERIREPGSDGPPTEGQGDHDGHLIDGRRSAQRERVDPTRVRACRLGADHRPLALREEPVARLVRDLAVDVHGGVMVTPPKTGSKLPSRAERQLLISTGRGVVRVDLKDGSTDRVVDGLDMPAGLASARTARPCSSPISTRPNSTSCCTSRAWHAVSRKGRGKALLRAAGEPGQLAVSRSTLFYADRMGGRLVAVDLRSRRLADTHRRSLRRQSVSSWRRTASRSTCPSATRAAIVSVRRRADRRRSSSTASSPRAISRPGRRPGRSSSRRRPAPAACCRGRLASGEVEPILDLDPGEQPVAAWPISQAAHRGQRARGCAGGISLRSRRCRCS